MNNNYYNEQFARLQAAGKSGRLHALREEAFEAFNRLGIPTTRNEEWKYTRIGGLFNKEWHFPTIRDGKLLSAEMEAIRLPGHEAASELVFVNGRFSFALSDIRSKALTVQSLEEAAANGYAAIVTAHFGHSSAYIKDGVHALNTAFVHDAVFIHVRKEQAEQVPVYVYHLITAEEGYSFTQPRSLVYMSERARVQLVETTVNLGQEASFNSQVTEIVLEEDAWLEYYKIQNDHNNASQVSTTHIHQVGKSYSHTVTISLNGNMVRNNLNVVLDAPHSEAHLYGLYFPKGNSHIDNHTIVDNRVPNCESNELYKGILDDEGTGVFNGKIFVRQPAQKTNAFQSNKNVLLSDTAAINTKPQLEIFADDVKCSHGCTVGRLSEEGLFYLQSRGIPEKIAQSMLLHGFAEDVLEKIRLEPIRDYADALIADRLEYNLV
jgi:Fe-S cluster assembly protein SufD